MHRFSEWDEWNEIENYVILCHRTLERKSPTNFWRSADAEIRELLAFMAAGLWKKLYKSEALSYLLNGKMDLFKLSIYFSNELFHEEKIVNNIKSSFGILEKII